MKYRSALMAGTVSVLAFATGGGAYAATPMADTANTTSGNTIAEVVVTARKREESLQRIPVAVTAETATQLQQFRVTQPTDLNRLAPSLLISQSSSSDNSAQIQLRAQSSSDSLLGLSQPVGLYEDSVNIPHPKGGNNAFVDILRVEVLNGPQGTLYGRNTTGGAVNIITRGADYSGIHGYAEGEVGNFKDYKGSFAVNLPIIPDILAMRVAYQHWSQQGFGRSLYSGQHFGNDHDDDLARVSVRFDPTPNFDVVGKFEYGHANHTASMIAPMSAPANPANIDMIALSVLNPSAYNTLFAAGNIPGIISAGAALLAPCIGHFYINCSTSPQHDVLTTYHGVLDAKWNVTDYLQIRSITGYHKFVNFSASDLGGLPGEFNEIGMGIGGIQPTAGPLLPVRQIPDQGTTQWTQEVNVSGRLFDDRVDWLVGGFGSWDKGAGGQQYGVQFAAPGVVTPSGYAIGSLDGLDNESDTWAFFTQDDFHITKQFSITGGLRYTHEHLVQDFTSWNFNAAVPGGFNCGSGDPLPNPADIFSCVSLPYYNGYTINPALPGVKIPVPDLFTTVNSNGLTYLLSGNFQVTDNLLFYVKTSRGFRGAAFGRNPQPPAKPEIDVDYELGMKGDFFAHRMRIDLALYQTNYTNKQEASATCTQLAFLQPPPPGGCTGAVGVGTFTTDIENAAKALIRGVELQFEARPIEGLTLFETTTYTDAHYVSFTTAAPENGVKYPAPFNLSGATLTSGNPSGAPLWKLDVGARYEWPVGPGVMGLQGDYYYRSKLPITPLNEDPNTPLSIQQFMMRPAGVLNARLDWVWPDKGLSFAFWCTNLNNMAYGYQGLQSTYVNGVGTMNVAPPRTFGFTVRKTFGGG
jgi:iron complex outermembrane receptor protein